MAHCRLILSNTTLRFSVYGVNSVSRIYSFRGGMSSAFLKEEGDKSFNPERSEKTVFGRAIRVQCSAFPTSKMSVLLFGDSGIDRIEIKA
jgi:hypothetical protein